jgi:hypothetical protein
MLPKPLQNPIIISVATLFHKKFYIVLTVKVAGMTGLDPWIPQCSGWSWNNKWQKCPGMGFISKTLNKSYYTKKKIIIPGISLKFAC